MIGLNKYWKGKAYDSMISEYRQKMQPKICNDGEIVQMMNDMIRNVANKAYDYANIERKNMGYWG